MLGRLPGRGRPGRFVAVLLAASVAASACAASDSSGAAEDGRTGAPGTAAAVPGGPSTLVGADVGEAEAGDGTGSDPGAGDDPVASLEELERRWAERRAAIVAALSVEGLGVGPDNIVRGPGGFEVDLASCPEGWNNTAGIDDTTIRIGVTVPQSGDQAAFNEIALGIKAYFDWVNGRGGVAGRSLQLIVRDDAYDPAFTTTAVTELLQVEQPLYVTNVGTPGALAVQEQLNESCVPQPFVASGHPALADPVNRPWTTGLQMSFATEALMWAHWIEFYLPDQIPVTVGAVVIDNDFGDLYLDSFQRWADANPNVVSEVITVRHDPADTSMTEEVSELAQSAPQVLLSMTTGPACTSVVAESATFGLNTSTLVRFTPAGCTQPVTYLNPVGPAADGLYSVGAGMRSVSDEAYADDPFVSFVAAELTGMGFDPGRDLVGVGFAQYGWAHVELLRIAAELPGGLSRSNVLLALRNLDLEHPMVFDRVRFKTSGLTDAYLMEGAAYSRYDADARAWYEQGSAVDFDGTTPPCPWQRGRCGS